VVWGGGSGRSACEACGHGVVTRRLRLTIGGTHSVPPVCWLRDSRREGRADVAQLEGFQAFYAASYQRANRAYKGGNW
jgi:hypothetical protein